MPKVKTPSSDFVELSYLRKFLFWFSFPSGITPMVEILEKYSGWPVVLGDDWESNRFDWLEISKRISNDGLVNLILDWGIGIDLKNSTRRVLIVSILR